MINTMIDIETLGAGPTAAVLSIGAVHFDPDTGLIDGWFHMAVLPSSAVRHGSVDGDTLKWWFEQSDEARRSAMSGVDPLAVVLTELSRFVFGPVWGNGASFDLVILENAYRVLDLACPWTFRDHRDCRTIKALADGIVPMPERPASSIRHQHCALDDAKWQATWVSALWRGLRKRPLSLPASQLVQR